MTSNLDEILICIDSIQDNLDILNKVANLMQEFGLEARLDKCSFVYTEIDFLGYLLSHNKVKPGIYKTIAVSKFPTPSSVREIKSFLGLTGYFRKFIKNYAST